MKPVRMNRHGVMTVGQCNYCGTDVRLKDYVNTCPYCGVRYALNGLIVSQDVERFFWGSPEHLAILKGARVSR